MRTHTTTLTRKLLATLFAGLVGSVVTPSAASAAPPPPAPAPASPLHQLVGTLLKPAPRAQAAAAAAGAPAAAAPAAAPAAPSPTQVEQKLADLHYDVGPVDGNIDAQAASAVMAFQKVNGHERTGELSDALAAQIMGTQGVPGPLVPDGEGNRVEVSLARQVLFLYEGGALTKILPVAAGKAETPTPTGTFRFYRYDPGWHTSRLGRLYNAEYFVGGYAIHGSLSVPAQPASHGCIRIPMSAAEWFPDHVSKGMQVVILES